MYQVLITRQNGEIPQCVSFFIKDDSLLDIEAIKEMLFLLWLNRS